MKGYNWRKFEYTPSILDLEIKYIALQIGRKKFFRKIELEINSADKEVVENILTTFSEATSTLKL